MDIELSGSAFVWCDMCGKKIDEGESAFVRDKTDADIFEQLELEESADLEVWECKACRLEWEAGEDE